MLPGMRPILPDAVVLALVASAIARIDLPGCSSVGLAIILLNRKQDLIIENGGNGGKDDLLLQETQANLQ